MVLPLSHEDAYPLQRLKVVKFLNNRVTIGPKEVLERLVMALSSGIWGIVLDRNLVDLRGVEEFFSEAKLWGTFLIVSNKNLTVIKINEKGLRNKCLYERCSKVPEEVLEHCIARCMLESVEDIRSRLIELVKNVR